MRRTVFELLTKMRSERVGFAWMLVGASLLLGCAQWLETSTGDMRSDALGKNRQSRDQDSNRDHELRDNHAQNGSAGRTSTTPARIIRFDGSHLLLGSTELAPRSEDKMLRALERPLADGHYVQAKQLVCLFPEVYREALLSATSSAFSTNTLSFAARTLDEVEQNPANAGWSALLQYRQEPSVDACIQARAQFVRELQAGNLAAQTVNWLEASSNAQPLELLRANSAYLLGMSQLLRNDPTAALQSFTRSQQHGSYSSRAMESDACLMACESARRLEDHANFRRLFETALGIRAGQVSRSVPGADAPFWSRAQHIAPSDFTLSKATADGLEYRLHRFGLPFESVRNVQGYSTWLLKATVAIAHFERGEYEPALIGFKNLEVAVGQKEKEWVQYWEAKCLFLLGQHATAIPMLQRLGREATGDVNAASRLLLGGREIQSQKFESGIKIAESGLRMQPSPSVSTAMGLADLGLAYLMTGQESLGLNHIHQAQHMFHELGHHVELQRSLENEKRYFEQTQKPEEVARVGSDLDRLNSQHAIPSNLSVPTIGALP